MRAGSHLLLLGCLLSACAGRLREPSSEATNPAGFPAIARPAACSELLARIGAPERYVQLAWDPAHRTITSNSAREARIGLYLESKGLLHGPIVREVSGRSEFIDVNGQRWDVKAFRSHDPNGARMPLASMISKIDEEIEGGENIILDISQLIEADRVSILNHLKFIDAKERALWYDEEDRVLENLAP